MASTTVHLASSSSMGAMSTSGDIVAKLVFCVGAEDRLAADDDHPILLDDFRGRPDRMFKLIPPQDTGP
ncbi:hypothetical protein QFZ69_002330 [Arthrobacter sp. V1I7]|nr:hypothetical protein [Arthrobacter sp. V1I7]MDQ0821451.1 hypothetical protein [Arthrobacter sp. V1I7]